ncbi:MAG: hypothetical protein IPN67_14980 [Bacteroidales bacterium]|nr:hypothetical protein [Bacteroidales bacterium]
MKETDFSRMGRGLYKARKFFDNSPFLLYNVDIISDLDLSALYRLHIEKKGLATLAVRNRPGKRFLLIDNNGQLRGWRNVSTGEEILAGVTGDGLTEIAFSSMHIADPAIFNFMSEGIYSMIDLYLRLATDNKIFTLKHDEGYWVDVGTPESLELVRKLLGSGFWVLGSRFWVLGSGFWVLGSGFWVQGSRFKVQGIDYPAPSTQYPVPSTQYPVPSTQL